MLNEVKKKYELSFSDKLTFNHDMFKRILKDLYNHPCKVTQLGISDIEHIMELSDNSIKLKKDIAIIYYYGQIRLIGFNYITEHFEIFNLPSKFEYILSVLDCFYFNESTIKTLLDSQFEVIDFYYEQSSQPSAYEQDNIIFDANEHLMYYIYPQ